MPEILIAPSILSADFGHLADQIKAVEDAGADWLHCDVMDGHFVSNITFGPFVIEACKKVTSMPIDVHLMIENPDKYVGDFASAGSDYITIHQEACPHIHGSIQTIKKTGAKAGASINPGTPVCSLEEVICDLDLVLVMSVNPGFGGQSFIESSLDKIARVRDLIAAKGSPALISLDGGAKASNVGAIAAKGAQVVVAGSAVYGADDIPAAVAELRQAASAAMSGQE